MYLQCLLLNTPLRKKFMNWRKPYGETQQSEWEERLHKRLVIRMPTVHPIQGPNNTNAESPHRPGFKPVPTTPKYHAQRKPYAPVFHRDITNNYQYPQDEKALIFYMAINKMQVKQNSIYFKSLMFKEISLSILCLV